MLIRCLIVSRPFLANCCGATVESEQRHNEDLREIYWVGRILAFITFYQNALHLTRVHALRYFLPECNAPRTTQIKTRGNAVVESVHRCCPEFLYGKFSTARLENLPNLRHTGVFQMSTMVNSGIGFQFKSL